MLAIQDSTHPESLDRRIALLAAGQHGVFTRAQAIGLGATRNFMTQRLLGERWERPRPGIYTLPGVPKSWHQDLLVVCFAGGIGSVASHRSAARLQTMAGFSTGILEITVPRARHLRFDGVIVHRPRDLAWPDLTVVDAIPVTTPPRTLIDLAGVVSRDILEEALDDALRQGLLTITWLRSRIDALHRSGRPGIGIIDELCASREDKGAIPESVLETKLYRVLKNAGLPRPVPQHKVRIAGRDYRLDFAYPDVLVGIEADGYASRASRRRWEQELARQNALVQAGWHLIRFPWTDVVERPDEVAQEVARALAFRRRG